ncbi:MAG: translocation/assembly module TamB domain-containing protein [Pseudomonadota bacterium]
MKRALLMAAVVVGALVLVVLVAGAWLVGTESGTRFALRQAQGFMPDGTRIGASSGRLADEVILHEVAVRTEAMDAAVDRLVLRWRPGELLRGELRVQALTADGVRYRARPEEPPPEEQPEEPLALPERLELPVNVVVEHLEITDVRAWTAPEQAPVIVHRVRAAAAFADSRLVVERLEVDGRELSAHAELRLTAAGHYPLDARARWRLQVPDYAPLRGTTRLGGSLTALQVRQDIAAPYNLRLAATVRDLLTPDATPALDAALEVRALQLQAASATLPEATVTLDAEADGPLTALAVAARGTLEEPEQGRFEARLRGRVEGDQVVVDTLEARQPQGPGALTGGGRVTLAPTPAADLALSWRDLRWPLAGDEPVLITPQGRITVDGSLDDYRFDADLEVQRGAVPPLALTLSARGSREAATADLQGRAAEGRFEARVDAAWADDVSAALRVDAEGLDPAVLVEDWPGDIGAEVRANARIRDGRTSVVMERVRAQGRLREQPLSLVAEGHYRGGGDAGHDARIDALTVALGASELEASGRVGAITDVRWRLDSEDLSALAPGLAGRLSGSGSVAGTYPRLQGTARLDGDDLGYGEHRLGELRLRADVDLAGAERSAVELVARDGAVAGTSIEALTLDAGGTAAEHRVSVALRAEPGSAELALAGAVADPWGDRPAWRFRLTEAQLAPDVLEAWRLAADAEGYLDAERASLDRHCWHSSEARLCLEARRDDEGTRAAFELDELAFAYFAPMLPEGVELSGAASASATARLAPDGSPTARVVLATTAGELAWPLPEAGDAAAAAETAALGLAPSRLSLSVDGDAYGAQADLVTEQGRLRLQAASEPAAAEAWSERPLSGRVAVDLPDLSFAGALLPEVEAVQGRVSGALDLGGTLGAPRLGGEVALRGGAAEVPRAGLTLSAVEVVLAGRGADGLGLEVRAESGGGRLGLTGTMSLPGDVPTADFRIDGEEFLVVANDEARIVASPDLALEADETRVDLGGVVRVDEARITPGARSPSAVTVSGDQVLVTPAAEEDAGPPLPGRPFHAEVRVVLGDDVTFSGFGLDAGFAGEVVVRQEPDTPVTASGAIDIVDGEYRAYGQGLVIERGRVYFAGGPVTEPALDVRAVRRPEEGIVVGADVQGTVQSPEFELFSEPPMSEQEQLSYLVLGRSLEEAPGGDSSALAQAALSLGLRGGDFLAGNIGERLGVDALTVETGSEEAGAPSDPEEAVLVAGKYLSPKLYVSYGVGLFNPASVLKMRYDISRNWKFVTESGSESTGADLQFTVEGGGQKKGDEAGAPSP